MLNSMGTRESPGTVKMVGRIRSDRSLGVRRASREERARGAMTLPRRLNPPRRSTKEVDLREWNGPSTGFPPRWCPDVTPLATTATVAGGWLPRLGTEWVIPTGELGRALLLAQCPASASTALAPSLSCRPADDHPSRGWRWYLRRSPPQPIMVRWLEMAESHRKKGKAQSEYNVLHRGSELSDLLQAAIVAETHERYTERAGETAVQKRSSDLEVDRKIP